MAIESEKLVFEVQAVIKEAEAKLAVVESSLEEIERDRTAHIDVKVRGEGTAAAKEALAEVAEAASGAEDQMDRLRQRFASVSAQLRSSGMDEEADKLDLLASRLGEVDSKAVDLKNSFSILAGQVTKVGMPGLASEILDVKKSAVEGQQGIAGLGDELNRTHPDVTRFDRLRDSIVNLRTEAINSGMKQLSTDLLNVAPSMQRVDNQSLLMRAHLKGMRDDARNLGMDDVARQFERMMPRLDGSSGLIAKLRNGFDGFKGTLSQTIPTMLSFGGMIGTMLPLIIALAGAVAALGAGLVALTAALAPLMGLLAAIPSALAIFGQALGTVFLALSRVAGAMQAQKKAQDAANASTTKGKDVAHQAKLAAQAYANALHAQKEAAEAVEQAQIKLTEATERYNRVQEGTALDVISAQQAQKDATWELADATKHYSEVVQGIHRDKAIQEASWAATQAQLTLRSSTERLYEAQERLRKLLNPDPTDVGAAELALTKAQNELAKVIAFGTGSLIERREAEQKVAEAQRDLDKLTGKGAEYQHELASAHLAVDQAQFDQVRATADVTQATKDLTTVQSTALENTKEYREATSDLQTAIINVGESQEALTNIQKTAKEQFVAATDAAGDAAYNLEQSHIAVQNAAYNQAHATDTATAAQRAYNDEVKKLSQPAKDLVAFLGTLRGKMGELQTTAEKGMLPGVLEGLKNAAPLFQAIKDVVAVTAPVIGTFAREFGTFLGSPFFTDAFRTIGEGNATVLGTILKAMEPLAVAFTNIMIAAQPLMEFLAQAFLDWSNSFATWSGDTEGLNNFFKNEVIPTIKTVMGIISDLFGGLGGLMSGSKEEGKGLLQTIADLASKFNEWANSPEGQEAIRKFFSEAIPAFREIMGLVGDIVRLILDPRFQETLRTVLGIIRQIVGVVGDLMRGFAWLPDVVQKFAFFGGIIGMLFGKFAILRGILMWVAGAIATVIAGFFGLATAPAWLVAAVVVAIVAILALLWTFKDDIVKWGGKLVEGILWVGDKIFDAVTWPFRKFWEWAFGGSFFPDVLKAMVDWFTELPGKILGAIGDVLGTLVSIGWDLLQGLWNGITNFWDWLVDNFKPWEWVWEIFKGMGGVLTWLFNTGKSLLTGLWNGIVDFWGWILDNFKPWEWIWEVFKAAGGVAQWLFNTGKNLLIGLWNGIADWSGELFKRVGEIGEGVVDWLAGPFINFSPSHVMREHGKWLMQGLGVGIEDQVRNVMRTASQAGSNVLSALDQDMALNASANISGSVNPNAALGAPGTQVINQYVTVQGSVVRERELADNMRRAQIQTGKRNGTAFGRYA